MPPSQPEPDPESETGPVVVVDAANVVGSRPDGWWRDRAGAASRLIDRCTEAVHAGTLPGPVLIVLEGQARAACPEGPPRRTPEPHPALVEAPDMIDDDEREMRAEAAAQPVPPGARLGDSWAHGVTVAHARTDGDTLIAARAGELVARGRAVLVVTADRELRERVRAVGAEVTGPGWLLGLLP